MNSDVEAKIIEAEGPIVLVVMPDWHYARILADNLRQQYKDQATGSMERLYIRVGKDDDPHKEIHIISGRTQLMRGRRVDDLIIHPHTYDLPNIGDILAASATILNPGGRSHIEWALPDDEW